MDSDCKTAEDIFQCKLCGECCRGFGGTYVTDADIRNIARFIGTDPALFVNEYCDMAGSKPVLTQGENGKCIFFDDQRQCTIHPVKPYMCRAWPFIRALIKNPENWDAMAGACPGMKKGAPRKDLIRITTLELEKLEAFRLKAEGI